MPEISPFANIPQEKENDFRFLLEKVYQALKTDIEVQYSATKGKVGQHEGQIQTLIKAVADLEVCPCNKRHNPGEKCPLFLLENEVLKNKWRNKGIYAGFFMAGAIFYYMAQLAMTWLKLGG